ncbi:MAG: hypothetical protein KF708_02835 [Pirellulales bacterium]|nr:hypothetical protein [Pirellulales bacterium]
MQSRGPGWWVLYGLGALCAFVLAGRLVAIIFSSFFSLLIVDEKLDQAGAGQMTGPIQVVRQFDGPPDTIAAPQATIPGAARPLTAADLKQPSTPYLETPTTRRQRPQ